MGKSKHIKSPAIKRLLFILCSYSCFTNIQGQDLKGAFFRYNSSSSWLVSGELYLYTNLSSTIFRPYVLIYWGVKTDTLKFSQSSSILGTVISKYTGTCSYFGPGIYNIINTDYYRIPNIKNLSSSQNEGIQLKSLVSLDYFTGPNAAPVIQNHPIFFSVNGNTVSYNPNFSDPDGDSLSYSIKNCFATNYYLPNGVTLDPYGVLSFSKDSLGIYAFSYEIKEWRKDLDDNYFFMGSTQIDFSMDINNSIGIDEPKPGNLNFSVFPNPSNDKINLPYDEGDQLTITNSIGQIVLKKDGTAQLDISKLPNGLYFVTITSKGGRQQYSKFIKE